MSLILVLNSGSSSIKYELIDMAGPVTVAEGLVERIGEETSRVEHVAQGMSYLIERPLVDHRAGLAAMAEAFDATVPVDPAALTAVGHRVVHGGDRFSQPAVIDDEVLDAIRECIPLAPLHNPANLTGIEVALQAFPDCPHVAVFDTAFHQTMPPASYRYAIDREVAAAHRIRRYGFHGTSHAFVSRRAAEFLDIPLDTSRIITLHLGNGASACAIRNGASIDTSMGLTPLAGLVMGTRSGDIDPGALLHLLREGMSVEDVDSLLNKRSGMKGLTGDNDLRQVHAAAATGDAHAVEALEVYVHAIRHYVGAYLAELGGADALVFTAGVGENDAAVREAVCAGLAPLGIAIDAGKNASTRGPNEVVNLTARGAPVQVLVVPTNEELEIATQSLASVRSSAIE
ncbi:MAG: acetate kinase [Actinobacteria bacterium]|nr:acetate kinase [Actinomycetota bacterium]MCB8997115.1 acetate kinase [Actinomycetota bacterium]MCB9415324.1 acetate kinase [Actinomycetota bacterium]MCB9424800.1 acetate kinase [Actinomycetota bacterium]HRY11676.1 acetate kinase [Candidatus Nanopelagicales bacterium]